MFVVKNPTWNLGPLTMTLTQHDLSLAKVLTDDIASIFDIHSGMGLPDRSTLTLTQYDLCFDMICITDFYIF